MKQKYVLGYAFDENKTQMVVVRKNRPAWQNGKYNGVGGHVEEGESYLTAMAREFREETGVEIPEYEWEQFGFYGGDEFEIALFRTFSDDVLNAETKTDEHICIYTLDMLWNLRQGCVHSLLTGMLSALDSNMKSFEAKF